MRPAIIPDQPDPRPCKSALVDPPSLTADRSNAAPTTFFLSREVDGASVTNDRQDVSQAASNPVSTLQDTIDEAGHASRKSSSRFGGPARSSSRRRSTIKAIPGDRSRRGSSTASREQTQPTADRCTTPSPLPSNDVSLPSSPKSISSRSVQKSEDGLITDETGSQAITSSEDDEDQVAEVVEDSQPELIMPSIKMPSRRPFTARGKRLGRFKILVAGQKGSGKTSLIKSIVQLCEDIVHVDPLSSTSGSMTSNSPGPGRESRQSSVSEIYASTRSYPSWWSDVDESRILRRRKSMGDSVLERNVCFVDTSNSAKIEKVIHYTEQQLSNAVASVIHANHDFAGLLSGRGGSQVDVILYLLSKDRLREDQEYVNKLSELSNVIPLIAKSDLLTTAEQQELKQAFDTTSSTLPVLPALLGGSEERRAAATAPYTVTSINGPDLDTMDASLLMSPEYVQPLLPSELGLLLDQIFDVDTVSYLKHTAAKKLVVWHATHPKVMPSPSPSLHSVQNSTLASPLPTSLSNSGVLIPMGSELSLTTSNSYALAKVADHAQREERLAQVRLSKWASDLQLSLQRERERYERLARNERALWLVERMGEEVRGGHVLSRDTSRALVRKDDVGGEYQEERLVYQVHDPLGLLRLQDTMRTRGWIALQVVGSFGVVGGLALWLAKTWGFTSALNDWAQNWSNSWFGSE